MLRKTVHSKLKGEVAATIAAGLVILVATGAQAKEGAHHQNTSAQDHYTSQKAVGGPVHGAGSSHNPIVTHPVHGPGSSHNPIVTQTGGDPDVRDHRGTFGGSTPTGVPGGGAGGNRGGKGSSQGGPDVRDHRENGFKP